MEKTLHGVGGPWAVSESIVNLKNRFCWTFPLKYYAGTKLSLMNLLASKLKKHLESKNVP